jgi:formylglycine-generating enzyme required for sulfatase activity
MGVNPSATKGDRLPVTNVSWDDAIAFAKKVAELTGRDVRIPTDAQWEYAARAGTQTVVYTGDDEDAKAKAGWCGPGSDKRVHEAGEKGANAFGLFDMIGNVREWTRDVHGDQDGKDAVDPEGPASGEMRISRGGAFTGQTLVCRAAIRNVEPHDKRTPIIGIRLVAAVQ